MANPLVLLGTGTSIGKTHFAERLLRALAAEGARALGYKPVESGTAAGDPSSDAARLQRASSFHVKQEPLRFVFPEPISPHLAARHHGVTLDLPRLHAEIARLALEVDALVVELPGGAFSPLTDGVRVAAFARGVRHGRALLVAEDRLGVLHAIGSTVLACAAIGLPLFGIVLNTPADPDDSTGTNAAELTRFGGVPVLGVIARGDADAPVAIDDPARVIARAVMT